MITQVLVMGQLGLAQCTLGEYMGQGSYLHIGRVQGSGVITNFSCFFSRLNLPLADCLIQFLTFESLFINNVTMSKLLDMTA